MRRTAALLTIALAAPLFAAAPATRPAPTPAAAPAPAAVGVAPATVGVAPGRALAARLPDIKLDQIPLSDAIDFVRDVSGANIHVNWRALELLNVTRQTPVSLQLSSVTTRRVLRSLLDETGAGEMLTFYVDEEVIEVTTKEISDSKLITKVYPVEDLVMTIPDFTNAPTFNLQDQRGTSRGRGGGVGGGGGQQQGQQEACTQVKVLHGRFPVIVERSSDGWPVRRWISIMASCASAATSSCWRSVLVMSACSCVHSR